MVWRRTVSVAMLALIAAGAAAQTAPGFFVAGELGFGIQTDDLVDGTAVGASLGYRFGGGVLIGVQYLFAGTDYYDYGDGSWQQAASWSEVDSGSATRSDWIFYRRRHVIDLFAGLSGSLGPIGVLLAGGLMFNTITLSEAADYYPAFAAAAAQSSIGTGTVLVSPSARVGLVLPARGGLAVGLTWVVSFDRLDLGRVASFVERNSLLVLGLNLQTGGGR